MTPEEREVLAGEYVLGALDARAAAAVERALPGDPELRAAVAQWENDLAPLLAAMPAMEPPPELWERIDASLRLEQLAAGVARRRAPRLGLWRGWAIGATAVAAGLAGVLLLRPPPERLMTVLLTQRDQPAWVVEAQGDALRLAALNPRPVEGDRQLQLWALPAGATRPTSLGLIPADGRFSVVPSGLRPAPGMLIEISLEPPGGSPTGLPTGPVLFIGRLSAAGSS
ncbi:anti-sigma factor domain-containing protein [Roseomonas sp. BN140053]|uniref:anti-sigma factor n=1 Tax=Roseomonas sp. BN140053 TaxID=3391898 RepID=UPI0039E9E85D